MKNLRIAVAVLVLSGVLGLAGCLATNSPHATFTRTPDKGYPPIEVRFDAGGSTSPNGAIVSYEWDFGDDQTGSGETVDHIYTEKGVYAVTLVVTDSAGATGARTQGVEALNYAPIAEFTANVYAITVDDPIWFDAFESYDPDGEIVEYLWDFGDGETDEGVTVSHAYTSAHGSGWKPVVTLTVVDETGAVGTADTKIIVVGCDSCK